MATQVTLGSGVVDSASGLKLRTNGSTEAVDISTGQVATLAQNPILTSGTANGVAYLNGSKVVTSGSALSFDGTNLTLGSSSGSGFKVFAIQSGTVELDAYANSGGTAAIGTTTSHPLLFLTGNSERMRLDSSGNLGLGVTPSAWDSTYRAFQFGRGSAIWSSPTGDYGIFSQNTNYSSGAYKYIQSTYATYYQQYNGQHQWFNAASGTAGGTISFTQAMTLDASGNLGVGVTTVNYPLTVNGAANVNTITAINNSSNVSRFCFAQYGTPTNTYTNIEGDARSTGYLAFRTNDAERARIDSSGNLLVGTTNVIGRIAAYGATADNTAFTIGLRNSSSTDTFQVRNDGFIITGNAGASPYNNTTASAANLVVTAGGGLARSTSSLKYKTDVTNSERGLAEVMQLRAVTYKGKSEADGDKIFGGLIAEEVHEAGLTEFVQYAEDGSPDALNYGNMVSLAFKAIQEQQAIIQQLQADVAALKA